MQFHVVTMNLSSISIFFMAMLDFDVISKRVVISTSILNVGWSLTSFGELWYCFNAKMLGCKLCARG
ncbi:hypothetical protein BDD12DRAFT_814058 [Trichophaea hybrida]|nr:hypothetical protein BDD12DRAFT_814058 [Trichophaea hybrida]